jgi:CPA2 family monovalent cation:H+ antiporter-2
LVNAALIRAAPNLLRRLRIGGEASLEPVAQDAGLRDHVVICGFGRIGGAVGTALETFQVPYAVIEIDPDIVKDLRARGIPAVFGTPEHRPVLEHSGTAASRLVVISIPDKDRAMRAIRAVRSLNAEVPILARAHRATDTEDLIAAGASEVILPELEGSVSLIRLGLRYLELPETATEGYVENFRLGILTGALPRGADNNSPAVVREVFLGDGFGSQTLGNARIRERFGVTVVAVRKKSGELLVNPSADTWLGPGDRVRVFGLPEQVQRFVEELRSSPQKAS